MDTHTELISLDKAYEVRYWMRELNFSEGELYEAVRTVGKRLVDLRAHRTTIHPPGR